VHLTPRATGLALIAVVVTAIAWPDGAERVVRGGLIAIGAAFVADLVAIVAKAFPTETASPFTPLHTRPALPAVPRGLVDLQREIRVVGLENGRRLPVSTRLRTTAAAAAEERLHRHGLTLPAPGPQPAQPAEPDDLSRLDAERAALALLGRPAYEFVTGKSATVDVRALLDAVDGP
jgi:hypothetical protein